MKNQKNNGVNLQKISTRELVEELAKREAVDQFIAKPYQAYKITIGENELSDDGPAVILRIWD